MYSIQQNFYIIYFFYLTLSSFFLNGDCIVRQNSTISNNCRATSRNLLSLDSQELNDFFDSFDTVICDMSALLKQAISPHLTIRSLKGLQKRNKEAIFIIDDSLFRIHDYDSLFRLYEYGVTDSQFIMPYDAVISYLKKSQVNQKMYIIGSRLFQQKLIENDIDVVTGRNFINENFNYGRHILPIDENVKAVIVEFDVNLNWNKLIQAGLYLKNETIQFLAGTPNQQIYADKSHKIIGPGHFQELLTSYSGREPLIYGKPGRILRDYMNERFPSILSNFRRVLFIGNSLDVDMKFAYLCGFQKLLIGPDAAELISTSDDCQTLPDYYVSDISKMS